MAYANNKGIRVHFQVRGTDGPALVLHHGFGESLESWSAYGYKDALLETHRLVLIDSRGHGDSDKPYHPDAYGLAERAADVVAVLDALAIHQADYLGYSMGAWIGFGLARYAPDRVRSLILGGAQPYGQSMAVYRDTLRHGLGSWIQLLWQSAAPLVPYPQRYTVDAELALAAAVTHDRPDISAQLPAMTMPCLLFAGTEDPLHNLVARSAAELPNATFAAVPGCNHVQTMIRSDLVLPHVRRFLTESTVPESIQAMQLAMA